MNSRKQETSGGDTNYSKILSSTTTTTATTTTTPSSSSSRQSSSWAAGFKNPRIVRVSPNFGGKDRHSKIVVLRISFGRERLKYLSDRDLTKVLSPDSE